MSNTPITDSIGVRASAIVASLRGSSSFEEILAAVKLLILTYKTHAANMERLAGSLTAKRKGMIGQRAIAMQEALHAIAKHGGRAGQIAQLALDGKPFHAPAAEAPAVSEEALLPGLQEALKWKPNTPQLENAMTYAWEQALKSFIRAIEKKRLNEALKVKS